VDTPWPTSNAQWYAASLSAAQARGTFRPSTVP
jgi:hypothetical protein